MSIDDVIAERRLSVIAPDGSARPVTLRLLRPHALADHFRCPIEIRWPDRVIRTEAGGADTLQAIVFALSAAQSMLVTSQEARESRLSWLGNTRHFGLPGTAWSGWDGNDLVLRSEDGGSFVKLTATSKRKKPTLALGVDVQVDHRGFAGIRAGSWLTAAALGKFTTSLGALLAKRQGSAKLTAEDRKSFALHLAAKALAPTVSLELELASPEKKRTHALRTGFEMSWEGLENVRIALDGLVTAKPTRRATAPAPSRPSAARTRTAPPAARRSSSRSKS